MGKCANVQMCKCVIFNLQSLIFNLYSNPLRQKFCRFNPNIDPFGKNTGAFHLKKNNLWRPNLVYKRYFIL